MTPETEPVHMAIRTYDDVPGVRSLLVDADARLWCAVKEHYATSVVHRGRSEYWTRRGAIESGPGAVHLSEPGSVHRDLRRDGPTRFQIVSFAPELISARGRRLRTLHLPPDHPDRRAFLALQEMYRKGESDALTRQTVVTEAIVAFERQLGGEVRGGPARIERAVEYVHAHLARTVTLDELAAAAGVDRFRLCRAFRGTYGVPPYTYVLRARIARARALLVTGMSASDVAAEVGFCDQSQLHRHFRAATGLTPGKYARAARRS